METSLAQIQSTLDGENVIFHPSPQDWRDHWIYFLLVDRFNNPFKPPTPDAFPCNVYQSGNFEGIKKQLKYLKELGAGAIWLSPVLMNPQWFTDYWGGYGIQNFLRIEPRFCKDIDAAKADPDLADKEFRELVDEAHKEGLYIIMDIVLNHVGDLFNYEGSRDSAPWNNNDTYEIYWRDEHGVARGDWKEIEHINNLPLDAGIFPVEFQKNIYFRRRGDTNIHDVTQGDFSRLKELRTDYTDATGIYPVRNYIIRSYQYLIAKFDLDGFRIDTAQYVHPEFMRVFGNSAREYALSIGKKNFYTCGEIWQDDDEAKIASFIGRDSKVHGELIGIDAAINFPLRKRLYSICKGFSPPVELALHFDSQREALKTIISSHGNASSHYLNFMDNHDLDYRFHNPQYQEQTLLMLTCLMTLNGIPCIYYGTEQGMSGSGDRREYSREAMWGKYTFDRQNLFYEKIRELSAIRNTVAAIRYGRQYFRPCSGDGIHFGYSEFCGGIIAYSRILNDKEVLIVANTSSINSQTVFINVDKHLNPENRVWKVIFSSITLAVNINISTSNLTDGIHAVEVNLQPMEAQILI